MKKCIIISDSFKGTLSSLEICEIAGKCLARRFPGCEAVKIPVADGGEGTASCFREACGGEWVPVTVQGPFGDPVTASYLLLPEGRAVLEMAAAAGLPLAEGRLDPGKASTYGVGQLIRHAIEHGAKDILLGLGGSCTNDGGCGCAAALGAVFTRADGSAFLPTGDTLDQIADITVPSLPEGVSITAMCDIDNPLCGPQGAAYVFAPQKGADEAAVERLDQNLRALDAVFAARLGRFVADVPGAGAAGGFGGGLLALFGAELRPGIEAVLDLVGFDRLLEGCEAVFTGEGRLDSQSLRGKVISGVARRARRRGVPVIVIAGSVAPELEPVCEDPESGIAAVFSINRQAVDFSVSRLSSRENYAYTFDNILRIMSLGLA